MAITSAKLRLKKATVTIDFGDGDTLNITYNPNALTTDAESERRERLNEKGEPFLIVLTDILPGIITDWDYLDDDTKKPLPITTELLRSELSGNLVVAIWNAIASDVSPGK